MGTKWTDNNRTGHQQPEDFEGVHYTSYTSSPIEYVSELISVRAYQLFEDRRYEPSSELNDWLKADQENKHDLGLWAFVQ